MNLSEIKSLGWNVGFPHFLHHLHLPSHSVSLVNEYLLEGDLHNQISSPNK